MNILITAGGTTEAIDQVRGITNHSSGRLGKAIAERFLAAGNHVTYLATPTAAKPAELEAVTIKSTLDLYEKMQYLLENQTFDAVIHSMAVSDFTPVNTLNKEGFIEAFSRELTDTSPESVARALDALSEGAASASKISSATEELIVFMKQTPKVIHLIKMMQPETCLVGFKLLVGVSKKELFSVARESLVKNHSDFVLANDLDDIFGTQHLGFLLNGAGLVAEGTTKSAIAEMIYQAVKTKIEEESES